MTITVSAGAPTTRSFTVWRSSTPPAGFLVAGRAGWRITRPRGGEHVEVAHSLTTADISDDTMVTAVLGLVDAGAVAGQWEFEEVAVGIIRSTSPSPERAWAAFYDNSVRALRDGSAAFAPVHRRARSLIRGHSVLEVGSCFGFLALQCAEDGRDVSALDISAGAVGLLTQAARRRRTPVSGLVGDATELAFADNSVDTVTLIHLLEHLGEARAIRAIEEALRVARQRVIVAVPYEESPSEHFGHLVSLTEADLRRWADAVEHSGAWFLDDRGGWLILDPPTSTHLWRTTATH
ncbi:MAG: mycofactocin oligosaccharide methyltransferase MftM [Gordonia sp. (in: high G+C Gram-positive bacteria)]